MAKQISHNRDKARKMYLESNGTMKLINITAILNLKYSQIRKWKSQDKRKDELKGALPLNKS
ncbi:phage terminase small subunit-related protein [Clostridium sp. UBA6640]|uniref:phage terminase small subunit-related protein n=1 Tax=Clostridium sp. UBA6640 TaxID=1946370 RepID=UPI0025BE6FA8|nr:phage terminase small subunit-related protein [Clostridium sp. UBA6640]